MSETNGVDKAADASAAPDAAVMDPLKQESYGQRMCPILSASMFSPGQEALQVCACKGPLCMFFVPIVELAPDGKPVPGKGPNGQCAIALIPTGLSHLKDTVIAIEQHRMQQAAGKPQLAQPGFNRFKR